MESFVQKLIGQIAQANQMISPDQGQDIPVMAAEPRKGMFGLKGQARDILGLLGDAFLVQGGADPLYRKTRQEERMADALRDYGTDELGAIGELASVPGAAENASEMMKNFQKGEVARGDLARKIKSDAVIAAEKKFEQDGKVRGLITSMMHAAKDNPNAWAMAKKQALALAGKYGTDLPYDIPDTPVQNFIMNEVSPEAVARLEDTKEYRAAQTDIKREEVAERKRANAEEERDQRIRTAASTAGTYSEAAKRLDDIQNPKGPKARRSAPIKLKEGDPIWKDGKKYVIKNGKPVPAK